MSIRALLLAIAVAMPGQLLADVLAASREGFNLRVETHTRADPMLAYEAFTFIDQWWDPAHTYSGDASKLTLDLRPGGAFLERPAVGVFVQHMQVVYVNPGREVRMLGGLGPLQPMGLHGALSVQFKAAEKGGTDVIMLYNVSGFAHTGLETLAPVVDRVQAAQMQRHAAFADGLVSAD